MLPQLLVSGLLLGGVYALISLGLTLIFGVMRIVNFAHGDFLMLSMFATYWLFTLAHLDPYVSLLIVVPAFFLLGGVVYWLVIRRTVGTPHVVQIFATVGLSIVLQNLALLLWSPDYRTIRPANAEAVIAIGGVRVGVNLLVAAFVAVAVAIGLLTFMRHTYTGKAIRALVQDRTAATLMGVDSNRMYLFTFAIGTACAGLAGSLLMPIYYAFPTVGEHFVLIAYVVVVLGGLGSMPGALLGGLIIGLVETFSGYFIKASLQQLVYFVVFILILILRPAGLFGIRGAEELEAE